MRVLVTGGAGFIGSALAEALVARGDEVRVLDNLSAGLRERVPEGAEFIEADLLDNDAVRKACDGTRLVYHQAAIRSVPKSIDEPRANNDSNITGTLNLLVAATDAGVERVVYASSSSVYGDTHGAINTEDMGPNPMSPYGVSKLAGELYCRVWAHLRRVSTVSLRYFNVFGPGQDPESKYSAVFPAFIAALVRDEAPEVHGDGEQTRDFSFIDDVVAANLAAATAGPEVDGEVFNVGGGRPKSVNEVLRAVADVLGKWIDPVHTEPRPGDPRATEADISRAERMLGWSPAAEWESAVKATVEGLRDRL